VKKTQGSGLMAQSKRLPSRERWGWVNKVRDNSNLLIIKKIKKLNP